MKITNKTKEKNTHPADGTADTSVVIVQNWRPLMAEADSRGRDSNQTVSLKCVPTAAVCDPYLRWGRGRGWRGKLAG